MGKPDVEFEGAYVDSRGSRCPGRLFVGIRGELADGGQHAPDALRDGAAAAVVTESAWRWIEGDAQAMRRPVLVAKDPLAVLQAVGRIALERSGAKVVGVTGATGKTTTKDIIVAMLRAAGVAVEGTPGNRNTEVGVPHVPARPGRGLARSPSSRWACAALGQIAELAALAPPDVACITAIGAGAPRAARHRRGGGRRRRPRSSSALRPGGVAVVPADEPLLEPHVAALDPGVRVVRFGATPDISLDLSLSKAWELRNAAAALACCRGARHGAPRGGADRGRDLGAARPGAPPRRRRPADRGLLQRQPDRDARRARRPRGTATGAGWPCSPT